VNRKRQFTISESSIQEEERQRQIGKVMVKLKDLEDESKGIMPGSGSTQGGSTTISNRTVTSSMSGTQSGFFNQGGNPSGYSNNKNNNDFISFKSITDKQLVTNTM